MPSGETCLVSWQGGRSRCDRPKNNVKIAWICHIILHLNALTEKMTSMWSSFDVFLVAFDHVSDVVQGLLGDVGCKCQSIGRSSKGWTYWQDVLALSFNPAPPEYNPLMMGYDS